MNGGKRYVSIRCFNDEPQETATRGDLHEIPDFRKQNDTIFVLY